VKPKGMIATGSGTGALAVAMTEHGALIVFATVLATASVGRFIICWVVADDGRARRLAMIIRSLRGWPR
jgi:hypothetical protein